MRIIIALLVAVAVVGNASMSSLSPSTIDISKIDCENVAYSADWGLDKTLEVMRHCTGADKEDINEVVEEFSHHVYLIICRYYRAR